MDFKEFILNNDGKDTASLLLCSKVDWPAEGRDIAVNTLEGRRRIRTKLPSWYSHPELLYPTRLCCEQCSSESTANLKASIAEGILTSRTSGHLIADLTGGLGVDVAAFAALPDAHVLHNEMDRTLSDCVRRNFESLGIRNAEWRCCELAAGNVAEILAGFQPEMIFVDPARRDTAGHKVFRLDECTPNLLATTNGVSLFQELLDNAPDLLIKLSPMADIQQITELLGPQVRNIWAVASAGECKELLIHMQRGWSGSYGITAVNSDMPEMKIQFYRSEETAAKPKMLTELPQDPTTAYLYEPGPALMKAGCYNLLSAHYGMQKVGRMTHLYLTQSKDETLAALGKYFMINEIREFSAAAIKDISRLGLKAEVTARNVPVTSDEIRRRLKLRASDSDHIFVLGADSLGRLLFLTSVCR